MMTIGPNSSGRSDARLIGAQPAWQLPIAEAFGLLLGLNEGRSQSLIAHTPTPPSAH
ncbi:hypothetical protein SM11_pC1360 (plasmid) [Sinorhizobium meliloti SM11]|uniref:Uncharacterized protein n=1 Tax=Sinorhizobium meliloti (strain SM11) TaxID=707241 RepID=F7XB34_SINMM|nr:hypothetical protein SM11_pC1360 [Sinorhizobium meliloti SM11]